MAGKIAGVIGIVFVLAVVAWVAISLIANAKAAPPTLKIPETQYTVIVNNAGTHYLTDKAPTIYGTVIGKRTIIMHGYYEYVGGKYNKRTEDMPIDEKIFGTVQINKNVITPTPGTRMPVK